MGVVVINLAGSCDEQKEPESAVGEQTPSGGICKPVLMKRERPEIHLNICHFTSLMNHELVTLARRWKVSKKNTTIRNYQIHDEQQAGSETQGNNPDSSLCPKTVVRHNGRPRIASN